jgi:hypothetical protein
MQRGALCGLPIIYAQNGEECLYKSGLLCSQHRARIETEQVFLDTGNDRWIVGPQARCSLIW